MTTGPIELELTDYDEDGLALGFSAAHDGLEIRVSGGVAGERVTVSIDHRSPHQTVAWGSIAQILRPSADRVEPACPCNQQLGCGRWLHLAYDAQLAAKRRRLQLIANEHRDELGRDWHPFVHPSPKPTGFRNRTKFVVAGKPGQIQLAAYAPRSHDPIESLHCAAPEPGLSAAAKAVAVSIDRASLEPWDEETRQGFLRYLTLRINHQGEVLATLVANRGDHPALGAIARDAPTVPGLIGLTQHINPSGGNVVFAGAAGPTLWGTDRIRERYGDIEVILGPDSFGQVNRAQAARIYKRVRELAKGSSQQIWDLFTGTGALALGLAKDGALVTGVERHQPSIALARAAAAEQGLDARFAATDSASFCQDQPRAPDLCVLNPPRSGCRPPLLGALLALLPRRLIYISCHPKTLARDITRLRSHYRLTHLEGFDMIPQTPHLELLAALQR